MTSALQSFCSLIRCCNKKKEISWSLFKLSFSMIVKSYSLFKHHTVG